MENNNIFFPVSLVPANEVLKMPTISKKLVRAVVGTIEGTNTIIHIGGKNYTLVKNSDLYPKVKDMLTANELDFNEGLRSENFSKFFGRYTINTPVEIAEGYIFKPTVIVTNSYDGDLKLDYTFGFLTKGGQFLSINWESKTKKHTESVIKFVDGLEMEVQAYLETNAEIITAQFGKLIETSVSGWESYLVDIIKKVDLFKTHKIVQKVETDYTNDTLDVISKVKENCALFGIESPNNFILLTALSEWIEDSSKPWNKKVELENEIRTLLEK